MGVRQFRGIFFYKLIILILAINYSAKAQITYQLHFTDPEPANICATRDSGFARIWIKVDLWGATLILSKVNSQGVEEWKREYTAQQCGMFSSSLPYVAQRDDGGFYLSMMDDDCFAGTDSYVLFSTDSMGSVIWTKRVWGDPAEPFVTKNYSRNMLFDRYTNNVIITALHNVDDYDNFVWVDYSTFFNVFDPSGAMVLSRHYNSLPSTSNIFGWADAIHDASGVLTNYLATGDNRVYNFDSTGTLIWCNEYTGPQGLIKDGELVRIGDYFFRMSGYAGSVLVQKIDTLGSHIDAVMLNSMTGGVKLAVYQDSLLLIMGKMTGNKPTNILLDTTLNIVQANCSPKAIYKSKASFEPVTSAIYWYYDLFGERTIERLFMDKSCGFIDTNVVATSVTGITSSAKTQSFGGFGIGGGSTTDTTISPSVFTSSCYSALPVITASGKLAICLGDSVNFQVDTTGFTGYQWYRNGNLIPGATLSSFWAKIRGKYKCEVVDQYGYTLASKESYVSIVCLPPSPPKDRIMMMEDSDSPEMLVYPNPATKEFTIKLNFYAFDELTVRIYDLTGRLVIMESINPLHTELQIDQIHQGSYFIDLTGPMGLSLAAKLIKL